MRSLRGNPSRSMTYHQHLCDSPLLSTLSAKTTRGSLEGARSIQEDVESMNDAVERLKGLESTFFLESAELPWSHRFQPLRGYFPTLCFIRTFDLPVTRIDTPPPPRLGLVRSF
ncbi:hypothetical protein PM082_007891 [Marasmius tenuissimus]|nr:hypothetical protein PM082_007891 [Marasmius tenuissimus]